MDASKWHDLNLAWWDERVPLHVNGQFYDVDSFRHGRSTLQPFEVDEVGAVAGASLVHLQCHFGLDTLSWARLGAHVTGLDFSAAAIDAATHLAADTGLSDVSRFVCADVFDAVSALDSTYDVVYTGRGALIWFPDLGRWTDVCWALTKPGGVFYLSEFTAWGWLLDDSHTLVDDYFRLEPWLDDEEGSYAGDELGSQTPTTHNETVNFNHTPSAVITALARRGFLLEHFGEQDYTLYAARPSYIRDSDGRYRLPPQWGADATPVEHRIPLMYSVRMRKPILASS